MWAEKQPVLEPGDLIYVDPDSDVPSLSRYIPGYYYVISFVQGGIEVDRGAYIIRYPNNISRYIPSYHYKICKVINR
jgi:hypothetical protein